MTVQRKNTHRRNLFIDGEFWSGVDGDLCVSLGIHVGQEVSEEQLQNWKEQIAQRDVFLLGARCLERRPYSVAELREKLLGYEVAEDIVTVVLARLQELGLLNDKEYAQMLQRQYRRQGYGPHRLQQRMKDKKIPLAIIEENVPAYAELAPEIAAEQLAKKYSPQQLAQTRQQQKAKQWLMRRGFDHTTINAAVEEQKSTDPADRWVDASPLQRVIDRKYQPLTDPKQRAKAWAYLQRQGVITEQINQIMKDMM